MSDWFRTFGLGSYGGLDDRFKHSGPKHPLGFAPPQEPTKPKKKPSKKKTTTRKEP